MALNLRKGGSQSPDRWLRELRNNQPRDECEARKLTKQQFRWLMEGLSIEQKKVIKDIKPDIY